MKYMVIIELQCMIALKLKKMCIQEFSLASDVYVVTAKSGKKIVINI